MTAESNAPASRLLPVPKPRRRWLTLLLAALIFVAGLISGSGLTMVVAVHRLQYAIHHPEEAPNRIATMLQRRLRLDNEQKAKIESIVAAHQVELMAIRRQFQPKVVDQIDQIRKEIGAVLNDSQREHWTAMFDDLRDRWLPPNPPAEKPQADVKPSA